MSEISKSTLYSHFIFERCSFWNKHKQLQLLISSPVDFRLSRPSCRRIKQGVLKASKPKILKNNYQNNLKSEENFISKFVWKIMEISFYMLYSYSGHKSTEPQCSSHTQDVQQFFSDWSQLQSSTVSTLTTFEAH